MIYLGIGSNLPSSFGNRFENINLAVTYLGKQNIKLLNPSGSLSLINSLNPVKFTWKNSGKEDEGLIAQEVLKVVPNAVTGSEETKYMMDYSKLVTPLVKAIQEQQEQIEELKNEIETLKN